MHLWEKILQLALLGSERSHLDSTMEEALRRYRIDPEDPLPQVILSSAASLHQVRRLNIPTMTYAHPLPDPVEDEGAHQNLSLTSLRHLQGVLSGRFRRALPELVKLLVERQFLLPPEFLPDLLDNCLQDPELWKEVQPLLGNRADWLIPQHPQWRILAPRGDIARWQEAGPEERSLIFGFLRQKEPQKALTLLLPVWVEMNYRKKLVYLSMMEKGLNLDDEDFLEGVLADSRKAVRLKAANLLASIPGSQLIQRIFEQLIPLFTFETTKQRLELELPKDIPTSTARDGIQPGVKKGRSGGLKIDWLFECVCRIPPVYWMDHFDWTQEQLIRYFDTTNRADLLLVALGDAALRFKDRRLGTSLIRYLVLKNGNIPENLNWKALASGIRIADFQQIANDFFEQQPGLLEEKHLLTRLLEQGQHPWDEKMSQQIINGLKQWMLASKTFLWNLWHYKRLLEAAGYFSPMVMLDELAADWPMQSPVWNQWAPDVERMLRIMRFRKEMKEALNTPSL